MGTHSTPNYASLMEKMRSVYNSGRTRDLQWRKKQLQSILRMFDEQRQALLDALYQDLKKPMMESAYMEVDLLRNETILTINEFENWAKPIKTEKSLITMMDNSTMQSEPYGVVLVIGAWNYPIQLLVQPLLGAVAAGNCVVLKPSEVSVNMAALFEKIIPHYLDQDCIKVVPGGVVETSALLREKFDYIFYTGNGNVGRIVYKAAAEHLTPVTLELGGKCPIYVDRKTDLNLTARRILWGKFVNAGQTCLAPDYILCCKDVRAELVERLRVNLVDFYGENPQKSESYCRIVNNRHFNRVKALLEGCNIEIGGTTDEDDLYIAPTVIVDVKCEDDVMQDEIFGPLLPILDVSGPDEAINFINSRNRPLALYVFTTDKNVTKRMLAETSSGGVTINDTLMHASLDSMPFGGIGDSGIGSYHGKFSFDTFSHMKPVLVRRQMLEQINYLRCPPYSDRKLGVLTWVLKKKRKRSGLMSLFPVVVAGMAIAYTFKAVGLEQYIPESLQY